MQLPPAPRSSNSAGLIRWEKRGGGAGGGRRHMCQPHTGQPRKRGRRPQSGASGPRGLSPFSTPPPFACSSCSDPATSPSGGGAAAAPLPPHEKNPAGLLPCARAGGDGTAPLPSGRQRPQAQPRRGPPKPRHGRLGEGVARSRQSPAPHPPSRRSPGHNSRAARSPRPHARPPAILLGGGLAPRAAEGGDSPPPPMQPAPRNPCKSTAPFPSPSKRCSARRAEHGTPPTKQRAPPGAGAPSSNNLN